MADQVDGIEVIIDVDTLAVLKAGKEVKRTNAEMVKDFNKVDNAIKKLISETVSLGGAISATGKVTDQYGNENKTATQALNQLTAAQANLGDQIDRSSDLYNQQIGGLKKVNTQLTQTSKAVKTGISGMGRNAGMAGIQFQQFFGQIQGGQSALLALSQQATDLGFVLGAAGIGAAVGIGATALSFLIATLGETEVKLLSVEELTGKLSSTLKTLNEEQKQSALVVYNKQLEDQEKKLKNMRGELLLTQNDLAAVGQVGETAISKMFGVGKEEATNKATQLKGSIVALELEINKTKDSIKQLNGEATSDELDDFTSSVDQLSNSLAAQIVALRDGEKASFEYGVRQQLNLKELETIPQNIQSQIDKIFELRKAQKEQAQAERDIIKQQAKDKADAAKLAQEKKGASSFATGIIQSGESETDRLTRQMAELDSLYMQGLLQQQEYNDAKVSIALQANKIIEDDNKKLAETELQRQNMILGTTASIFGSLAELSKAFQGEQSNTYKALFAVSKGFAIAQAGLNLSSALSQTLADPSALTPAQKFANYAAVATAGGQLVSAISSASYGGGRLYGGGVESDKIYPVAENGRPEVLQQSDGSQYLIGGKGKVIPNGDIGGMSGGGVTINIANNAAGVEVTQTGSSDDGRIINLAVNEVANQINRGQGVIPKALKNSTSTQMRATR